LWTRPVIKGIWKKTISYPQALSTKLFRCNHGCGKVFIYE
jgi:hypothetical protein